MSHNGVNYIRCTSISLNLICRLGHVYADFYPPSSPSSYPTNLLPPLDVIRIW